VHDSRTEFQVVVRLDTLLGDRLGNTFAVTTFKLTGEEISEPPLKERDDAAHEEQPHSPTGSPKTATRTLSDWTRIETVIDKMFQILRHPDLPHKLARRSVTHGKTTAVSAHLVLVPVHSRQGTDMGEDILDCVGELEGIDVSETILNVGIDNKFGQPKNFSTQVECVSKT
jgi:hypothetical protein